MEIPLGGKFGSGKVALCSPEDYDTLIQYKWHISCGHVAGRVNGSKIRMSRFLMRVSDPKDQVGHKDSNPLNHRRENLRVGNLQRNSENNRKQEGTSSMYIGVSWNKVKSKFVASVQINGIDYPIGHYKKEVDAAIARDTYVAQQKITWHKLNFPERQAEYE